MLDIYKKLFHRKPKWTSFPEGPDGREVLNLETTRGLAEYKDRTYRMASRQHGLCSLCGLWMKPNDMTTDHDDGRGMGGSRTDDRIMVPDVNGDLQENNSACHWWCNGLKGSVRLSKYREVA